MLLQILKIGKRVPEEIAIVGIGKVELGPYLPVPLTHVDLPRWETGVRSAEFAIALSWGAGDKVRPKAADQVDPNGERVGRAAPRHARQCLVIAAPRLSARAGTLMGRGLCMGTPYLSEGDQALSRGGKTLASGCVMDKGAQ